jgi:hypothetical protein
VLRRSEILLSFFNPFFPFTILPHKLSCIQMESDGIRWNFLSEPNFLLPSGRNCDRQLQAESGPDLWTNGFQWIDGTIWSNNIRTSPASEEKWRKKGKRKSQRKKKDYTLVVSWLSSWGRQASMGCYALPRLQGDDAGPRVAGAAVETCRPIRRVVSKGVEDGRRPPTLRAGQPWNSH